MENIIYDIFYLDKVYQHMYITDKDSTVYIDSKHVVENKDNSIYIDGVLTNQANNIYVIKHDEIHEFATNLPKNKIEISNMNMADIHVNTNSIIYIYAKEDHYLLDIYNYEQDIYIDGKLVTTGQYSVDYGSTIIISGLLFIIQYDQLQFLNIYGESYLKSNQLSLINYKKMYNDDFPKYRRSPRIYLREPSENKVINLPPNKEKAGKGELLRTIVPPIGMVVLSGAASMISGGNPLMMMGMGGASLLTAGFSVSSYITNKKEIKNKNAEIDSDYRAYVLNQKNQLEELKNKQKEALEYNYPSIKTLVNMALKYDSRIYERTINHEDFLQVRIGKGNIPTSFDVKLDDKQLKDELYNLAKEQLYYPYTVLNEAPIIIDLLDQTLGLVGSNNNLVTAVQSILFQIATVQSYHDVEMIVITSDDDYKNNWKNWRFLPHLKLNNVNLRGIVHSSQSKDMVLNSFYQIITKRKQELSESKDNIVFKPHYILTILDEKWLLGHGLNEFLAEDMSRLGVTVIWGKEAKNMLPETVTTMIEYNNSESGILINKNKEYVNQEFVPNHLPKDNSLNEAIYKISNLEHVEVEKNSIPESIDFLELYNVKKVEELNFADKWQQADTSKTLSVPLGVRSKDDIVELNLHERAHGPHGLVAGTTGSGKSEIVQSYILSLAVNFAPEDVGFLPIDFKGGGMANLFQKLPHLLGSITNLDGAASVRALQSIRAELKKRQRLFGEYGVNHINGYTKLYKQGKTITDEQEKQNYPKEPLPHLFLISDEFAELKANEPEFMSELVSTARIGRSLGVHLILATQKPSGVVDDQIWSNSRFKLALKVADVSDSREIIKTPDAATITQPGRAYLQVGNNEIYELFQSAWSGAKYTPDKDDDNKIDERIWLINDLGQPELLDSDLYADDDLSSNDSEEDDRTQLDVIVETISDYAKKINAVIPSKPWLPPLSNNLITTITEIEWGKEKRIDIPFGMMDLPFKQTQEEFKLDITELSHIAIYGSPSQGKSIALQTIVMNLARQNNPQQVQFNLWDFGTNGLLPLKDLPHVIDMVKLEEEEKLIKYLKRVRFEIQNRKDLFTEFGVASLSQYENKTGKQLPIQITLIDTFDSIKEHKLEDEIESVVNQILRDGASVGMYVVMTALRTNTFKINMLSNIPTSMGLFLVEDNAIKDIVGRDALIPQEIPGRLQINLDTPIEIQVYLPTKGSTDIERLNNLEQEIQQMANEWEGELPIPIPMLPKDINMAYFYRLPIVQQMLDNMEVPIALNKETTQPIGFKPIDHGYFVIGTDTPQQEENIMQSIIYAFNQFMGKARRIVFNANDNFTEYTSSFDMIIDEMNYSTIVPQLYEELENRLLSENNDLEPIYVYIPDTQNFYEKSFISFEHLDGFLRKGAKAKIYFVFQGQQKQIETGFDEFNQRLRNNIPAGMFGTRIADQNLIVTSSSFTESIVGVDEASYFEGRIASRVKLVSEW